ncbi:hypothetical protein ISN45_Aa01g036260 [Arabidopsis thaliana x Arabidopsis arenosa]|uniref:Uncharacterized protein n=1 Tax=Arabidopsis thaliana x Arabidopsis arenosa TaxID=1240361 RepID=A0A8T2C9X3_9BRAS|nr:hypothetical protein ISN45_Aa01g036260 [Arabidopsis thaliana x Arabidopsis arenosa]
MVFNKHKEQGQNSLSSLNLRFSVVAASPILRRRCISDSPSSLHLRFYVVAASPILRRRCISDSPSSLCIPDSSSSLCISDSRRSASPISKVIDPRGPDRKSCKRRLISGNTMCGIRMFCDASYIPLKVLASVFRDYGFLHCFLMLVWD